MKGAKPARSFWTCHSFQVIQPLVPVQDIAAGLHADVVHITSSLIARLLECPLPLTTDGIRAPAAPISRLRFRVAAISGWLNSSAESLLKPGHDNTRTPDYRSQDLLDLMRHARQMGQTSDGDDCDLGHVDAMKVDSGLNMIR